MNEKYPYYCISYNARVAVLAEDKIMVIQEVPHRGLFAFECRTHVTSAMYRKYSNGAEITKKEFMDYYKKLYMRLQEFLNEQY